VRVGVCDFPSSYAFPPYGYGGIERWLWAVAIGARRSGADVCLVGPDWRDDLPGDFSRLPVRLEDIGPGDEDFERLRRLRLDLLVVGHEYPSHPRWRAVWSELGCDVASFQHDPKFRHTPGAFDAARSRLYCYSDEMMERYRVDQPRQDLSVQFGLGEESPALAQRGEDLVWIGRVDADKTPHVAAIAATKINRRLRIIGPVLDHDYLRAHREILHAPGIELVGELAGSAKLDALRTARTMVYTCARDYVEAGAAVFGEALRVGTPVAALVWRSGTCAHAALCDNTGRLAQANPVVDDETAATSLAEVIVAADELDAELVQEIGLGRFDPQRHFRALTTRQC
jgi:hypothetical protein